MTALPEYLIPILGKIAEREGFVDFSTEIDSGTNIGDNFMSRLLRIVITGHRQQGNGSNVEDKLHLLCKLMPEDAKQREVNQSELTFYRESYFYTKIVPQFTKFQTDRALPEPDQFKSFPKCYEVFSDPDSNAFAIIIEDLRPKDFAMWPKEKPMPIEYLSATLRELAKFHAVSMALKDQQPEQFAEHKKLTDLTEAYLSSEILRDMFWESYQRVIDVLEDEEHKTVMRDIQQNYKKYFLACQTEVASDRFGVVGHGDFWNNNILFRTRETTKNVEEVCLVDFQDIHYVSPAVDLLYIIFTATDKITRKHHFRDLLRTYYDQLTKNLRKLGSDPEKLFPYVAFINELKECGIHAFLISPLIVQLSLVESNDEENLNSTSDNSTQNGMEFHAVKGLSERSQQLFSERMCDCIEDLVKFGYYRKI